MSGLSRRHFLKTSALATGAVLAAPRALGANERIRVGVIGCRNRGGKVAEYMAQTGQFEIATLCDCDTHMFRNARERLEDTGQTPGTETDFQRILEDQDIDAVVVATPDHWHGAMTVLALDAGKHVYCEKPLSYNIQEGKDMVAAHKRNPKLTAVVGTQQRSGRHFQEARQFIREGGLGDIGFCRNWIVHTRGRVPEVPDSEPPAHLNYDMWVGPAPYHPYNEALTHYNWHWVRDYGTGEMGNWGAHWLDVARWLLDLDVPTSAMGAGGTYVVEDAKQWPDTQTVLYEYPNLTMMWEQRLWSEWPPNRERSGTEIGGSKGTLIIDRGNWMFYPRDGRPERHDGSELDQSHAMNFAQAIRGEAAPNASLEDGHKSAILCHLGNIAVSLQRRLAFDTEKHVFKDDAEASALLSRPFREPWNQRVTRA